MRLVIQYYLYTIFEIERLFYFNINYGILWKLPIQIYKVSFQ
jgi:hypothetical protein